MNADGDTSDVRVAGDVRFIGVVKCSKYPAAKVSIVAWNGESKFTANFDCIMSGIVKQPGGSHSPK